MVKGASVDAVSRSAELSRLLHPALLLLSLVFNESGARLKKEENLFAVMQFSRTSFDCPGVCESMCECVSYRTLHLIKDVRYVYLISIRHIYFLH